MPRSGRVESRKTLPAVVRLVEPAPLEHGPGGAVEHDDALADRRELQSLVMLPVHAAWPRTRTVRPRGAGAASALTGNGAGCKLRTRRSRSPDGPLAGEIGEIQAKSATEDSGRRSRTGSLRPHRKPLRRPILSRGSGGSCNFLKGLGGGMSLAALQPGDDRLRRLHPAAASWNLGQPGPRARLDQGILSQLEFRPKRRRSVPNSRDQRLQFSCNRLILGILFFGMRIARRYLEHPPVLRGMVSDYIAKM